MNDLEKYCEKHRKSVERFTQSPYYIDFERQLQKVRQTERILQRERDRLKRLKPNVVEYYGWEESANFKMRSGGK